MPIYTASKQQPPDSAPESGGFRLLLGWLVAFLLFFALPLGILFEGYRVYLRSISRDERAAFTEYLTRELTSFRNNAANEKVIQQLARNYRDSVRRKLPDFSRTTALSADLASSLPPGSALLTWDGKGQLIFPTATAAPAQAFVKALSQAYAEVSQEALVTGEAPFARFNADNEGALRAAAPLAGLSFPYLTMAAAPGSIHQHTSTDRHLICFWDTFVSGSLKNGGFSILVPGNSLAESWGLAQLLAADPTANPEQTSGFIDPETSGQRFISYKPLASMARTLFEQYRSTAKSPVVRGEWNLVVLPFSPTSSVSLYTLFSTARFRTEFENGESLGLVFAALSLLAGIALFFLVYRAASTAGLSLRTKIAGLFGLSMLLPLSILSLLALHYSLDHGKVLQSESNQLLQNEMKRLDDGAGEYYRERAAWLRSLRTHPALASADRNAITELFLNLYKERKLHRAYLVDASGTVLFDQDHLFDEYGRKAFVGELGRRAIEAGSGLAREPAELIGHDALARNFLSRLAAHRGILQPVNWPGTSRRTAAFIDLVPPAADTASSVSRPRALIVTLDLETTDAEYLTAAIREQSGRSDDLRLFALSKEDISVTIPTLNPTLRANLLPLVSIAQLREYPAAERISDEKRPLLAALSSGKNLDGYYLGAGIGWQSVTAPLERAYGSLLAALLVSICGSLLLVTFLIRGVVDPISSLSLGTRAIAAGDLTRTLPVLERDELGDLSRAFNEMTKRLRSRLTELTVLYTLTQKASTVTNQREVFALAARHLRDHLAAADCGTAWIDGSDGKPNLAEARDQAAGEIIRKAVATALQTRVNTLMKLPGNTGTVLGIPLFFEEQDFGGLYLLFTPPSPQPAAIETFTADERSFIETLRHHLSLIIEKQRLFEQAITDGLTHLYVRRFFLASLEKEIARARRYRTDVALLMLDIDHFKRFNDSWGHQVGDLVLRETSQRILENIRAIDTPGRYGGEELAVILPQTSLQDAVIVAERIRKAIADATYSAEGNELTVTVSIGVTSVRDRRLTMEALISECDKALYKAKAEGRNRVVLAEIEMAGGAA